MLLLHQGPECMARLKYWDDGLVSAPLESTQLCEVTRADWFEAVLRWGSRTHSPIAARKQKGVLD